MRRGDDVPSRFVGFLFVFRPHIFRRNTLSIFGNVEQDAFVSALFWAFSVVLVS